MRLRTIGLTLALCLVAVAATFASDPNLGTWKLNETKSKIAAGIGKNDTVVYEAAGDSVKVSIDGTTADGKAAHTEWTGKFDGKEYAVTWQSDIGHAVLHASQRQHAGVRGSEGRQAHAQRPDCRLGRWQDPHRDYGMPRTKRV